MDWQVQFSFVLPHKMSGSLVGRHSGPLSFLLQNKGFLKIFLMTSVFSPPSRPRSILHSKFWRGRKQMSCASVVLCHVRKLRNRQSCRLFAYSPSVLIIPLAGEVFSQESTLIKSIWAIRAAPSESLGKGEFNRVLTSQCVTIASKQVSIIQLSPKLGVSLIMSWSRCFNLILFVELLIL